MRAAHHLLRLPGGSLGHQRRMRPSRSRWLDARHLARPGQPATARPAQGQVACIAYVVEVGVHCMLCVCSAWQGMLDARRIARAQVRPSNTSTSCRRSSQRLPAAAPLQRSDTEAAALAMMATHATTPAHLQCMPCPLHERGGCGRQLVGGSRRALARDVHSVPGGCCDALCAAAGIKGIPSSRQCYSRASELTLHVWACACACTRNARVHGANASLLTPR